jgi:hypothetical protein
MYVAKRAGRDRVVTFSSDTPAGDGRDARREGGAGPYADRPADRALAPASPAVEP